MKSYTFEIEYTVPEFASVTVKTPDPNTNQAEAFNIALKEFQEMYPEAIDPEIISYNG